MEELQLRVIAGEHKGRQLKPVPHRLTRPTTDKVKEAVFQIIGPFFEGGWCLDLFAGSGGLGIEAISRGMEKAVLVDKNNQAIQTINENISALKIENQTEVYRTEAMRALKAASKRNLKFRLIILDPPYGKVSYVELLEKIAEYNLLEEDGVIICEHESRSSLPSKVKQFQVEKNEIYGSTTTITIYTRAE